MENKKTHWKKLENPDYIGAYSLDEGKDIIVTIDIVKREMITGQGGKKEECTVAYLRGQKPFILNRTNMKMIQKIYNTPYIEEWKGKKITLYVAKIKAFGEDNVECLRIRKQTPQMPELTPKHPRWNGAKKAMREGTIFIEQIESQYNLTKENRELLLTESI